MAQIIKHRRGSIGSLKSTTARNAELIIASGSISDLSGPFVFIGSPNSGDEGIAGAFNTVSKLYTGTNAPTITAATYGSGLDGTPYYASGDKSLYILNNSNVGNTKIDLSGNIEGNTISGVTINNLTGTTAYIANISGSLTGSGEGLYDIPASGITGLNLSKIYSGSVQVTTDSVTGEIHLDATSGISATGSNVTIGGGNNSYMSLSTGGYAAVYSNQGGTDVVADNGGNLWLWAEGGGEVHIGAYSGQTVEMGRETDMGNINMLNGSGNTLNVFGDILQTGSLYTSKIIGTGSLFLQPNDEDSRLFEIYNTTPSDIHIHGINGISYFGNDTNYLRLDDGSGNATIIGDNSVNISSNVGSVYISSYDGSTLELNTDGGEGNVNIGNNNNNINGYSTITNFNASDYAQLMSSGSYIWVESVGAHLYNDNSSDGVGFTARPNGIIEATGSLFINGDTNINGDTSVTGALVVANGSATFDQGLVAQNSNMLLTSGSNLIVQNNGNVQTDYLRGATQEYNYLSLNGNGVNGQDGIELSSTQNISLWAEGGYVNVTGSLNVSGDIIFSGSINIGDNLTGDTINFQGEVSSSILPKVNNAFDLGSVDNNWRDLYVSGTAHVGVLEAGSISLSGITVFNDLQVSGSIYNFTLSPTDVVFVDGDQRLTGSAAFTYAYDGNYNDYVLTAPIIRAANDGNGTNFLIGNDMWLGDIDEANATRFMGNEDNSVAKIYLNAESTNNYINANYNTVTLSANNQLNLKSQNSSVNIESYDGWINLNDDSGNNIGLQGNTYVNNSKRIYVNNLWDNSDNSNYLQLYGWNTDDGYWWESGNGTDTTLLNNINNANLNILQTNSGDVNIDATGGSVNIHSANGMNVTGSLVVSDASGVFNSSLIVNNSDLTLDGGSDIHMNDSAHLYFDTCVDMYYDSGDGNFIFYNDCNNFQFRNNVSITGSLNVSSGINTDNIHGATNYNNVLRLNGGSYGAPDVEIASQGQISLFSEGSNSNFAINMTGSVHVANNLDVSGSVYLGQIYNYNSNINGGAIYIDSSDYTEISHNDGDAFFGVDGGGIYGTSNVGVTVLNSNAGDTTINANNGYNVNINANNILLNGDTAVTGALSVSSDLTMDGNLYVSGNLEVLGSSTNVHLESHTVNIGDNIILVNAYSPFQRYAGLAAYDSGSSGVSGSLLWDSLNDYWMFVSASGQSSKLVGTTAGTYGSEVNLTSGTIPIATGNNNIGDSLLTYSGTTLAYNTNKFTIDSGTGETYISGNVTLNSGASDLGSKTSGIVFRNDDDVLGFVSTTETTDVMDGVLGYRSSDGVLVFSTVIDGGSY